MKKFSWKFIYFTLPLIVSMLSFELLLRSIPNDYKFKNNYLEQNSDSIQVLYLGNSHTYYGINPKYSQFKSFNAAHVSQSLNFDNAILRKFKDRWSNLKYIVVPLEYFSIYTSLENGVEDWRVKNYRIYYDIKSGSNWKHSFEIFNGKFSNNIYRIKSSYLDNEDNFFCSPLGWRISYCSTESSDLDRSGITRSEKHTVLKDPVVFENNIKNLNAIIKFAKILNVKVLLVTTPAFKSYTKNLNVDQLNTTINIGTALDSQHGNVSYYNLLNSNKFIAEDFQDADHLNGKGAKKLTLIIDNLIIENSKKELNYLRKSSKLF